MPTARQKGTTMLIRVLIAVVVLLVFDLGAARANDSEAEVAVGGLTLKQSQDISLDREDLFISQDEVRVDYLFTNYSGKDIETLVAFPLPDQIFDEDSGDGPAHRLAQDLNFKTTVAGKPVTYEIVEQAMKGGRDVTAELKAAGLGVVAPRDNDAAIAFFKDKPKAVLDTLVKAKLVDVTAGGSGAYYSFLWDVWTTVTRKQLFPAGKTVAVSHRYKPVAGGSVGGNLSREHRTEKWAQEHAARFCIEKDWFRALDKAVAARATADNASPYAETWLGYVLKSGANWKCPIKDFRLVVDKGKAENLVSFCAEGVKKISPTQFEVKKKDFEPDRDLNVLIVTWWKAE
jgi:hypothetical protein